ncbi:hypothetical protein Nepgr_027719 [Nepenthes gracilis]|uniref:Uncharacterized protein n=1 Tax=Nepenthes gracilis TaxID=150966 RepID=A0AAD3Y3U3_NEPGR|nr:hypothetical protein Nepgr_027719 [Nepenthes gracilis]
MEAEPGIGRGATLRPRALESTVLCFLPLSLTLSHVGCFNSAKMGRAARSPERERERERERGLLGLAAQHSVPPQKSAATTAFSSSAIINLEVDGDAISDELGLNPGVDGSTPESIARIASKYSLEDVVDGLLNKAPFELQEVRSIPLSGCPGNGSEASVAEAEMIRDSGRGLELALPNVDPYAGDPLSDDYGILQRPDHHLPCCSKASCAPVGPSSGNVAAVQGSTPCNPLAWAVASKLYAEAGTRCTASGVEFGCFC